jgi:hypothetical protein
MAVLLDEYRNEVRGAYVSEAAQQALVALLAPVGRLIDYRAHFP